MGFFISACHALHYTRLFNKSPVLFLHISIKFDSRHTWPQCLLYETDHQSF